MQPLPQSIAILHTLSALPADSPNPDSPPASYSIISAAPTSPLPYEACYLSGSSNCAPSYPAIYSQGIPPYIHADERDPGDVTPYYCQPRPCITSPCRADLAARLIRGAASFSHPYVARGYEKIPPRGGGCYLGGYAATNMLPYEAGHRATRAGYFTSKAVSHLSHAFSCPWVQLPMHLQIHSTSPIGRCRTTATRCIGYEEGSFHRLYCAL